MAMVDVPEKTHPGQGLKGTRATNARQKGMTVTYHRS